MRTYAHYTHMRIHVRLRTSTDGRNAAGLCRLHTQAYTHAHTRKQGAVPTPTHKAVPGLCLACFRITRAQGRAPTRLHTLMPTHTRARPLMEEKRNRRIVLSYARAVPTHLHTRTPTRLRTQGRKGAPTPTYARPVPTRTYTHAHTRAQGAHPHKARKGARRQGHQGLCRSAVSIEERGTVPD